ncbi:pyridoxamine 5'-phosphate oxidase family protein [Bacillus alkalicellulosilyticus]|uniref:pyridoxamine 5'-phosphate oxidase family protein n=1 Tax=Alkalihalobacterium alkalicellulosilyticum TaxID=1912214 RepID=UPI000997B74A|nr:pyridoxamine 5'-phosphate oxidase family protein [Bacillus alkalicellulosilyticus]
MGKEFLELSISHIEFIKKQKLFFVASAPLAEDGHVNLSPKGYDVFRVISPNEVAYLDVTGSGNETSAHILENGRITIMFTAFEGPPMILRLYGQGEVVLPDTEKWDELSPHFEILPGARQIIYAKLDKVKSSCGFSVPFYTYEGERDTLKKWTCNKSEPQLEQYRKEKNSRSMDGIITPIGERLGNE